jgi:hypothetical protein
MLTRSKTAAVNVSSLGTMVTNLNTASVLSQSQIVLTTLLLIDFDHKPLNTECTLRSTVAVVIAR